MDSGSEMDRVRLLSIRLICDGKIFILESLNLEEK